MKRSLKQVMAALLTLVMLAVIPLGNAFAATKSELQKEKEELNAKISAARNQANALRNQSAQQMEFVAALRQETEALEAQIDNLNRQVAELQNEIQALNVQIEENQVKYDQQYEAYCQRLRALYMSGSVSNLEVILTAGDMSDLLTRAELISSISKQDQSALEALQATMDIIAADKKVLTERKSSLDANLDELKTNKADLDVKLAERQAAIDELEAQANAYTEAVSDDQEELDRIEKEIQRLSNISISGGITGTGQFTHPCPGYSYVSANYPSYSSGRYHGGIDFAAPYGTAIVAADSGTVTVTNYWNYSFGYHIMISHGNGVVTLYGHTSQILVSPGQNVSKGQVIARVGSTGNSTGNHLHFEVRENGQRVSPWNYL